MNKMIKIKNPIYSFDKEGMAFIGTKIRGGYYVKANDIVKSNYCMMSKEEIIICLSCVKDFWVYLEEDVEVI